MSFEDEWAQHKAAAESQSVSMQLNGRPADNGPSAGDEGGGGAGKSDLVVAQDDVGAIGSDAFTLHGKLKKSGDIAGAHANSEGAGASMRAAQSLASHSFLLGDALSKAVEVWGTQLKTVLQGCAHISNHLDYTKKSHHTDDVKIGAELERRDGSAVSPSQIYRYLK
ncbi:hypothetical protein [Streptomyces iconiensis]|uniref:AG1 protein n=1 Tax=Streptomyces iconiensis TaxID=1384038 RepID=A0ABT6ZZU8_9ACTN|nr:hypothetical protein [Streptomyces iconiensis]MDJ1134602.1 hypothetical protein [Streptomyces iconiensis]